MKIAMYLLLAIVIVPVVLILAAPFMPTANASTGLQDGVLAPCPNKPNCVCSEARGGSAFIEPLVFEGDAAVAWQRAKQAVTATGGDIKETQDNYLRSTYTTRWLRFVDDLELRLDKESGVIHVRSASRVGHSDFGVNRKRVEKLRVEFARLQDNGGQ